jgi:hypothetical protein
MLTKKMEDKMPDMVTDYKDNAHHILEEHYWPFDASSSDSNFRFQVDFITNDGQEINFFGIHKANPDNGEYIFGKTEDFNFPFEHVNAIYFSLFDRKGNKLLTKRFRVDGIDELKRDVAYENDFEDNNGMIVLKHYVKFDIKT